VATIAYIFNPYKILLFPEFGRKIIDRMVEENRIKSRLGAVVAVLFFQ